MNPLKGLLEKFALYHIKKVIGSLSLQEQIEYIAKLLANYYQFDDRLSDEFYHFILFKISKSDGQFLNKENIYQVIAEYKGTMYVDDLDWFISPKQYLETPIKHINRIRELLINKLYICPSNTLNKLYQNEILYKLARQTSFLESECIYLAYKLYLSVGFNHSMELLQDNYGEVSFATLYFLFYLIDVKNISSLDNDLMLFLFGEKREDSAMFSALNGKSKELFLNFSYFYDNFSSYYKILQGNLSKKRVEELLKDRFLSVNPIYPNIRRDIVDDMISSFKRNQFSDKEIQNICFHYFEENMFSLISSSIPQVYVEAYDLQASVLAKSDPKILVMGYRTNNCFRINGDASILFSKAIKSKDFRVVSISSYKDNDVAMMLVARNGNVLIAQGIEISKSYQDYESRKKIYQICTEVLKKIMEEANKRDDNLILSVMGCSNSNDIDFNSNILPFRISPVFDGNPFQNFYNGFQFPQCLISLKSGSSFQEIKLYSPSQEYFDKREDVICLKADDYSFNRNLVYQRLMAISYFANTQKQRIRMQTNHRTKEIYCNNDWYLIVFEDGEIDGVYLENDSRAKEEYEYYMEQVKCDVRQRK